MNCDIVIPVWNQFALTKDCIESIFKNTADAGFKLIIIDNASDEETRRYLAGVKEQWSGKVILVRNDTNLGFIKAVNQGLAASSAPYICLLNNDTLVTKNWLKEMIAIAESADDIGLVNPSSNNLGQSPAKGEPLELYAEKMAKESGSFIELGAAIGFCMLIKRRVYEKIGVFDEIYGMGNFDDTDFSRRAVQAGYRCVRACGAYVYHRQNTSFNKVKTFDEDFKRNREIYEFRWGRPKRIAYVFDKVDTNVLRKMNGDAVSLARNGNWIWYFIKDPIVVPKHSNIIVKYFQGEWFYPKVIFTILKKKKKFNEIVLGEESAGKLLAGLSFIHKAQIKYY
ncbi:MAG: glycosyltransferase family 2 protein [Candidatus Omnitrophica bacterium]|nr:glycosyltransferase family 2 protein [Candidatus Omnitrophota bacterium]MDD5435955.1 glycosyltransferase family 2 protein [Candidatus Omnitrophota bacterium]